MKDAALTMTMVLIEQRKNSSRPRFDIHWLFSVIASLLPWIRGFLPATARVWRRNSPGAMCSCSLSDGAEPSRYLGSDFDPGASDWLVQYNVNILRYLIICRIINTFNLFYSALQKLQTVELHI